MSRSERQYVWYVRGAGEGAWGPREDNQRKKAKRRVHNTYIILVLVLYLVLQLLYGQKNVQHRKTKGKARHLTALRCAGELYIAGLT